MIMGESLLTLVYAAIPAAKEEKVRLLGRGVILPCRVCTNLDWQPDSSIQGDRRVNEASPWWNVALDSARVVKVFLLRYGVPC